MRPVLVAGWSILFTFLLFIYKHFQNFYWVLMICHIEYIRNLWWKLTTSIITIQKQSRYQYKFQTGWSSSVKTQTDSISVMQCLVIRFLWHETYINRCKISRAIYRTPRFLSENNLSSLKFRKTVLKSSELHYVLL